MEANNIIEVVEKLVGPISPTGQHGVDSDRLENLKKLSEVVSVLIGKIDDVSYKNEGSMEKSVKEMVEFAEAFLSKELGIKNCICDENK